MTTWHAQRQLAALIATSTTTSTISPSSASTSDVDRALADQTKSRT